MRTETKERVAEKIDEISKSISNTEAGTGAEKNLVNNMVLLARLEQEDEKQADIRSGNSSKNALEDRKFEHEKSKDKDELDFKKLCEDNRMAEADKKLDTDYIKFEEELKFKREQEANRKKESDAKARQAEAELDFKMECESNRRAEEVRKRAYEKDELRLKEDELEFKRECERNRHEEAMKKIEAEMLDAQARRDFERFKFEQEDLHRRMEEDAQKKERLINAAKVGLTTAVGVGSIMTTIYTVKAACTVDKDFDAMPSKTLQSLMIRGITKVNI